MSTISISMRTMLEEWVLEAVVGDEMTLNNDPTRRMWTTEATFQGGKTIASRHHACEIWHGDREICIIPRGELLTCSLAGAILRAGADFKVKTYFSGRLFCVSVLETPNHFGLTGYTTLHLPGTPLARFTFG